MRSGGDSTGQGAAYDSEDVQPTAWKVADDGEELTRSSRMCRTWTGRPYWTPFMSRTLCHQKLNLNKLNSNLNVQIETELLTLSKSF